jgi:hypothetical protein
MSTTKNPSVTTFGNDTTPRYGTEVRRIVLHQTDLAQPYLLWQTGTIENNIELLEGSTASFVWQVNGSLVVDHTLIQWGINPDPINNPAFYTMDHDEHAGDYSGGTGWNNANSGHTNGVAYNETITLSEKGDYYFVAKAQVDQVYANVLRPDIYRTNPYLRLVKERTNASYYEMLEGSDGNEEIFGQTWWYSTIIHVKVVSDNNAPTKPDKPTGQARGKVGQTYTYSTSTEDIEGDQVYYLWDWGDDTQSGWLGPYDSGAEVSTNKSWTTKGDYIIRVKAKDTSNAESFWSDPLSVKMPKNNAYQFSFAFLQFLELILERFPQSFPLLRHIMGM